MRYTRTRRGGWPYSNPPNVPFVLNKNSPLGKGLVGWWVPLAIRSTSVIHELARGNNAVGSGATRTSTPDAEIGWTFNTPGANDYADAGDVYDYTGSFTIAAWIRADSMVGWPCIVGRWGPTGTNDKQYKLCASRNSTGTPYIDISSTGADDIVREAGETISTGDLVFICGRYNALAQTLDMFVNGRLSNGTLTAGVPAAINSGSATFRIGEQSDAGNDFDGSIGPVLLYDWAIPSAVVLALYRSPWELYAPIIPHAVARKSAVGLLRRGFGRGILRGLGRGV